ncbi:MAG: V-type ATP synthase subunit E family protein [bacterium]|nr:V-type ATP synthase subunit E family protein [bacterium]
MSVEKIISTLEAEAAKEISAIESESQARLDALRAQADQRLAAEKSRLLDQAETRVRQNVDMKVFAVKSELKRAELAKKHEILDRVFQSALKHLSGLSEAEYLKLLERLMRELPKKPGAIRSAKGKLSLAKKAAAATVEAKVDSEEIDSVGGFVWQSDTLNIDDSFEQLIRQAREVSETSVAQLLFGKR